jgi:hypothetical protein
MTTVAQPKARPRYSVRSYVVIAHYVALAAVLVIGAFLRLTALNRQSLWFDEADVVMTLKNEYKQKTPMLREAEERGMPIYVLKSNTILQMQASLTSLFSLEVDPREAALRETEEAIGIVMSRSEPVELSPQNAYIRRLQHQMAERANLVSRSRGREPYRRVRLYPDAAKTWR